MEQMPIGYPLDTHRMGCRAALLRHEELETNEVIPATLVSDYSRHAGYNQKELSLAV